LIEELQDLPADHIRLNKSQVVTGTWGDIIETCVLEEGAYPLDEVSFKFLLVKPSLKDLGATGEQYIADKNRTWRYISKINRHVDTQAKN
jgi:hypothetical protein